MISRAYGEDKAHRRSSGADGYTISECEKDAPGTDVIMHMKPDDDNERYSDFLMPWKIMRLVKKYSDYIRWPIQMDVERPEARETGEKNEDGSPRYETVTTVERETRNSQCPYGTRPERGHGRGLHELLQGALARQHRPAAAGAVTHQRRGPGDVQALLFIPGRQLLDYMTSSYEPGLALTPAASDNGALRRRPRRELYFVRGIVDSPDLSLNISREMLQHDRPLRLIAQNINKRIKNDVVKMLQNDRPRYEQFYENYGRQLRYGAVANYGQDIESLRELLLYHTGEDTTSTLKEYAEGMKGEQSVIYYAVGESVQKICACPRPRPCAARATSCCARPTR